MGQNVGAAEYIGVETNKSITRTMMLSGALAGLAGGIFYLGVQNTLPTITGYDIPGFTFNGISLSLIAYNAPIGILFSSLFLGTFENSATLISAADINPYVSSAVTAVVVFLVSISNYFIIYRPQDKLYQ
jgi:simple sugar transport system permease protein